MEFLEFLAKGGTMQIVDDGLGERAHVVGHDGFRRPRSCVSARASAPLSFTLNDGEVGGRWSAPPGRSEGVVDDAAASVPRIIWSSLLNALASKQRPPVRASTRNTKKTMKRMHGKLPC